MRNLTITLCLMIAVLLGSVGVSASADFQKGLTAYKSGDYATALREWTPLAEQGNADAQYFLGHMYRNGWGVSQDYKTALKWWKLAAKQGSANTQYNLSSLQGKIAKLELKKKKEADVRRIANLKLKKNKEFLMIS